MKKLIFILILLIGGTIFLSKNDSSKDGMVLDSSPLAALADSIKLEAPAAPLVVDQKYLAQEGSATEDIISASVISASNLKRKEGGLKNLNESEALNQMALIKLQDMIKNDYFSHDSPDGDNLKDLAQKAGYEYLMIGENLAIGGFRSNADLVEAWMQSPTHRANIMNPKYAEIGVAVGKTTYENQPAWLVVEHFGLPGYSCPGLDLIFKKNVENKLSKLETAKVAIEKDTDGVVAMVISSFNPWFEKKVYEYNKLVKEINELIPEYNRQMQSIKNCVGL
jgi:uncharacterized protein YkwD